MTKIKKTITSQQNLKQLTLNLIDILKVTQCCLIIKLLYILIIILMKILRMLLHKQIYLKIL